MGMRLSRPSKSIVALITAALLLLCQTAFAAQACAHSVGAQDAPGSAPCHEPAGDMNHAPVVPAAPSACDAAQAFSGVVHISVFAITDLPALALVQFEQAQPRAVATVARTANTACHPPPLTILHCRFLN